MTFFLSFYLSLFAFIVVCGSGLLLVVIKVCIGWRVGELLPFVVFWDGWGLGLERMDGWGLWVWVC